MPRSWASEDLDGRILRNSTRARTCLSIQRRFDEHPVGMPREESVSGIRVDAAIAFEVARWICSFQQGQLVGTENGSVARTECESKTRKREFFGSVLSRFDG